MLKEKRQILFNYKNVFESLNIQRENHGDALIPESTILDIVENPKDDQCVIISLKPNSSHKVHRVNLSKELFIKGLCLFCVKNEIIFPQSGEKSISLKKGKVILNVLTVPK